MAQKRLPVRKIREVLRLKAAGVSDRKIAAAIGCSRSTVQLCLQRAAAAGVGWPLPDELDDVALDARLYPKAPMLNARPVPDFAALHRDLSRAGVTRMLLWQEYKAAHPAGWQYSVFCCLVAVGAGEWRAPVGEGGIARVLVAIPRGPVDEDDARVGVVPGIEQAPPSGRGLCMV